MRLEVDEMLSFSLRARFRVVLALCALLLVAATPGWAAAGAVRVVLTPATLSPPLGARSVTYRGVRAVHFETADPDRSFVSVVKAPPFSTGTIDVDVAGKPNSTADTTARGFIGIVFATRKDGGFEGVYIRTKNGRSSDQAHRNHAAQYISEPEWGWRRLRTTHPSAYESYVDLVPGAWTHLRVQVAPKSVRLYVDHAAQPTLIVPRIIGGPLSPKGEIGLFYGPRTEANFAHLVVTRDPSP